MTKKRKKYLICVLLLFTYPICYFIAFVCLNGQMQYDFLPCSEIAEGLHEHVELYGETYDPNNEDHANNRVGMYILDLNHDGITDYVIDGGDLLRGCSGCTYTILLGDEKGKFKDIGAIYVRDFFFLLPRLTIFGKYPHIFLPDGEGRIIRYNNGVYDDPGMPIG